MQPFSILVLASSLLLCGACSFEARDYGPADPEEDPSQGAAGAPTPNNPASDAPRDAEWPEATASVDGCAPLTCVQAGASCGTVPDGCGGALDCGGCPLGETCGAAGLPNHCASQDGGSPDAQTPPDCSPGARECVGLQVRVCDAAGAWQNGETCSTSCVQGACEDACALPWGGSISHGQSTTAYLHDVEQSPQQCSDYVETRICDNGVLSGSFPFPACSQQFRDCPLAGYGTLLHGTQVMSYVAATVPCGGTCAYATISCNDGTLYGGTTYVSSCSVGSCDCHFSHGQGFATLSPGQSCSSELVNVNTGGGCTGGAQHYASFYCTYTCNANGTVSRSPGGPCELGNGACGGSVSGLSTTTCPDGW